jgi:hypothetical protein
VKEKNNERPEISPNRPDLLFSYWIFTWALIYFFILVFFKEGKGGEWRAFTPYFIRNFNPFFVFVFAIFENILMLFFMIYKRVDFTILVLFCTMLFFAKIIPVVLLSFAPINGVSNILSILVVFIVYNLYLLLNGTNVFNVYVESYNAIIEEKTPFIHYMKHNVIPFFWKRW